MESKDQPAKTEATATAAPAATEKDNSPVQEKAHVTIRCKPLGKGASDSNPHGADKKSNKVYAGADQEKHCITFKDVKKKDSQVYKFPDLVATEEFDNEALYINMMKHQVDRFLDGYNVNFIAYGQTGSGKTFTTSGPAGVFKKVGEEALDSYPAEFGLFPRAACDIFKAIQKVPQKTIMTINVCESNY